MCFKLFLHVPFASLPTQLQMCKVAKAHKANTKLPANMPSEHYMLTPVLGLEGCEETREVSAEVVIRFGNTEIKCQI